jgi:hypothetical protein
VALKHQEYGLGERELRAFEDALLQSLQSCGECKPETVEAWRMIERRGAEVDAGTADTISLDEYQAHIRERRAARARR